MNLSLQHRRFALCAMFFIPGLAISSWVTRTPAIRDALSASTAEMGLVLLGLSIGSMTGILSSGPLSARLGTRRVIVTGMIFLIASMLTVGVGALAGNAIIVGAGLALFGLGMGGSEVALNVDGADLEARLGKPVLPLTHGFFSLGTVAGASMGIAFTAANFSVVIHLCSIAVLTLILFVIAIGKLGPGLAPEPRRKNAHEQPVRSRSLWADTTLLMIGGIVMAMAFAEGTANDWLPLVMVDGHGFDPAWGSAVYALFAAAMTIGRFSGTWILQRVSRVNVVRASALSGAIGLACVIFIDNQLIAALAVAFWGLGASLGFPIALSAAGDSEDRPAARVSLVATLGYVAFLIGPPLLGFAGETFGLRPALLIVLALVLLATLFAPTVRPRTPRKQTTVE